MYIRSKVHSKKRYTNDLNRWTISFADYMTLMFAVFVVLYSVSSTKEQNYENVISSIQNATKSLNNPSKIQALFPKSSNSIVGELSRETFVENKEVQIDNDLSQIDLLNEGRDLNQLKLELEEELAASLNDQNLSLELEGDWLTITMGNELLFAQASHTLLNSALDELEKISKILIPVNNFLRIRGYTDTELVSNEIYKSNWELSTSRALSVLHEFVRLGIYPPRLAVEGFGSYVPYINEQGNIDQFKSRRVVIAISQHSLVRKKVEPKTVNEEVFTKEKEQKNDSEQMQEIILPNNKLIITTRQD